MQSMPGPGEPDDIPSVRPSSVLRPLLRRSSHLSGLPGRDSAEKSRVSCMKKQTGKDADFNFNTHCQGRRKGEEKASRRRD